MAEMTTHFPECFMEGFISRETWHRSTGCLLYEWSYSIQYVYEIAQAFLNYKAKNISTQFLSTLLASKTPMNDQGSGPQNEIKCCHWPGRVLIHFLIIQRRKWELRSRISQSMLQLLAIVISTYIHLYWDVWLGFDPDTEQPWAQMSGTVARKSPFLFCCLQALLALGLQA